MVRSESLVCDTDFAFAGHTTQFFRCTPSHRTLFSPMWYDLPIFHTPLEKHVNRSTTSVDCLVCLESTAHERELHNEQRPMMDEIAYAALSLSLFLGPLISAPFTTNKLFTKTAHNSQRTPPARGETASANTTKKQRNLQSTQYVQWQWPHRSNVSALYSGFMVSSTNTSEHIYYYKRYLRSWIRNENYYYYFRRGWAVSTEHRPLKAL